jgi:hypothetical protein
MTQYVWTWALCETLHFIALSLLIGTVGTFDLRLIGVLKDLPAGLTHRLIPWGVGAFLVSLLTGVLFVAGTPAQFLFNFAFWSKVVFLLIAGVNAALFYSTQFRTVRLLKAGEDAPRAAKIIGAVSLISWFFVMYWGRMLTFYRPAFIR